MKITKEEVESILEYMEKRGYEVVLAWEQLGKKRVAFYEERSHAINTYIKIVSPIKFFDTKILRQCKDLLVSDMLCDSDTELLEKILSEIDSDNKNGVNMYPEEHLAKILEYMDIARKKAIIVCNGGGELNATFFNTRAEAVIVYLGEEFPIIFFDRAGIIEYLEYSKEGEFSSHGKAIITSIYVHLPSYNASHSIGKKYDY